MKRKEEIAKSLYMEVPLSTATNPKEMPESAKVLVFPKKMKTLLREVMDKEASD